MIKKYKIKLILLALFVVAIIISAVNYSVTVFSIGDSTMCNFDLSDATHRHGWMQNIGPFFTSEVKIVNYAKSGRSSKSYIDEGYWDWVYAHLKSGDYVIIQFGHNDEKSDTARHTDPWTTYSENLRKFVSETRQKGAHPILCTPIVRRQFDGDTIVNTHGDYPAAVRKLAADSSVFFVDMEVLTKELLENYGPDSSLTLFAEGDNTHLVDKGATEVAGLFVNDLEKQGHALANYLVTTSLDNKPQLPNEIRLFQNFPNPFNPVTKIEFIVNRKSKIKLEVFNILGEKVRTLLNDYKPRGRYSVNFDASGLSSGIYIYRLSSMNESYSGKMLLSK